MTKLEGLHFIQPAEFRKSAITLVDAFQDDPVWNAIFKDVAPNQLEAFFESPIRYCHTYGKVCAPSRNLEGIMAWVPGEYAEMTLWRMIRSGAIWPGMKMGYQPSQLLQQVFRTIDLDRKNHMGSRPYFYLNIIGVAQKHQGQGFGSLLLKSLIEISQQDQVPIYLETETEENVQLYQHFGFSVIKKATLPTIDLPMWEMIREVDA
jgi:GNAT superfamily N-acetyltransferase